MKAFPGTIERGGRNYRKILLNDEQRAWLADVYPATENERIAKAMGISKETVRVQARKIGLEKSEAGMKAIRKRQQRQAAKTNEANGCYDRKRGHPPSQATLNGTRQRWREINAGLREHPMVTFRKRHPKKYKEVMERKRQDRINLIQKEKRRIIYGLERKTTLSVVVMKPYTRRQLRRRYDALKRGYLLDEDCREGQPGRYVIYYDDETFRSERFERNCIADGFTFQKDE